MIQFSQAQLSSAKEASNFRKTYYINYSLWTRKVLRHVTIVYQYISRKFILNDFWNKEYSYIESGISTTVKHSRSHKPPFDWLSVMWILIVSTLIVGGSPLYFEHNLEGKKNWHSKRPFSMFVIKSVLFSICSISSIVVLAVLILLVVLGIYGPQYLCYFNFFCFWQLCLK